MNKEYWDERYARNEYAYGEAPNVFIESTLPNYPTGKILFPADGEGRNSVFAAKLGWTVSSFDLSETGKQKAMDLATANDVAIDYEVCGADEVNYELESFDAIAFVFAHFPAAVKQQYNKKMLDFLKPSGLVFFEAFGKDHIEYQKKYPSIGGPKDVDMLFSKEELLDTFANFEVIILEVVEQTLDEGPFHQGVGSVIRFVGRRK
jgi:SAM-dependent methyltransferase